MSVLLTTLKTRWFWYSVLTVMGWAGWAILLKLGSLEIPVRPTLFWQTTGMLPVALCLLVARSFRIDTNFKGISYSLLNGTFTAGGILALLAAYRSGGNTSVVAVITSLYPLVTFALAVALLHERLTVSQMSGLVLATVSIIIFSL
jgi:uncharacterized membrane protein